MRNPIFVFTISVDSFDFGFDFYCDCSLRKSSLNSIFAICIMETAFLFLFQSALEHIESNLEGLATVLESDLSGYKDKIFDILVDW